ncbi:signal recognition particle-docking protein FtsY [Salinispira pacifica]
MNRKRFGARLKELFGIGVETERFYEELEDLLIEGDLGPEATVAAVGELREFSRKHRIESRDDLAAGMKEVLSGYLKAGEPPIDLERLNVYLVLGVNGTGKTTTIAKLAEYHRKRRGVERVVLVAGDTFRAAAVEQLKLHGERLGVRVVSQSQGADPAAVMYDGITSARSHNEQLVLADTAGRMHNRSDLVNELAKIDKVIRGRIDNHAGGGNYRKLLVVDATTGQNGLRQAEIFHEAVGVDGVILTKYDSTAKGGMVVSICRNLGLPFSYVGTGEKYTDIEPFESNSFLDSLLDIE